tara:strand:+ start:795 stop:1328 length:534 start_codon:yes stop_codon:yes gene_type:complete
MANIYEIIASERAIESMPPVLRQEPMNAWLRSLMAPIQELIDDFNTVYRPDVEKRTKYNSQKVVFEWLLNEAFGTTFVQPNGVSDIYIENHTTNNIQYTYLFNNTENLPFYFYNNTESTPKYLSNNTEYFAPFDFTVWIPYAVWLALAASDANRNAIVQSVVDKFKIFPLTNDIQTY